MDNQYTETPWEGGKARIVAKVPKRANFECAWNNFQFYTWKGELVAVPWKKGGCCK